ncbi:MAG: M20/M25/M40 family metallo-hydrolase [Myxococcales bacterium]
MLERALAALKRRTPEILQLTEAWVRVNSHSRNVVGVDRVGELISEALQDLPLTVAKHAGDPWGTHLSFSTSRAEREPSVLLIGHHDTVFPAGTFEGFRSDGARAYGPGVLDMKGGLAIVAVVLRVLHEVNALDALPLRFISVADEEVGSPTSRGMLEGFAKSARAALVFEAGRSGDAIVTSRRGSGFARVKAFGRAAHAGNNLADGRNAVWALSRFVDRVQVAASRLEGASLSTGLFHGGSARNTVAENAEAELDLRFVNGLAQEDVAQLLESTARGVEGELEGVRLEVALTVTRRPLEATQASSTLCRRFGACQLAAGLASGEAPRQGGGSDANTVGAVGLPAIDGLGPRGRGYHTHDEQIEIDSLALKADALLRFLAGECAHSEVE